jgi:hypothetical protein
LSYLVMGYRMSNQAALGQYSPYYLMHGRQPLITGTAAKQLLGEPIDFDEPEQWVRACEQRAQVLHQKYVVVPVISRGLPPAAIHV